MTARGMDWNAVIVQRHSGARLFLSMKWETGKGLIYSSNSKKWSSHTRPFDGPILAQREVADRDDAVSFLSEFQRSRKVQR